MAKIPIAKGPASIMMENTADAMDNIWDAYVRWPWETEVEENPEFSYRCQGFQPPEDKTQTYGVNWHGIEAQMISSGSSMKRSGQLKFRCDATWNLYNKFVTWKKNTSDSNTSGVANKAAALGDLYFTIPGQEFVSTSFEAPKANDSEDGKKLMIGQGNTSADGGTDKALTKLSNCIVYGLKDVQVIGVSKPQLKQSNKGTAFEFTLDYIFGDIADSFYDQISE